MQRGPGHSVSSNGRPRKPVIYRITSPSGKAYVGKTVDFEHRMQLHAGCISKCPLMNAATKKYGWDNMKVDILMEPCEELLWQWEICMIEDLNTRAPNGYNLLPGGEGGNSWGIDADRDARVSKKLKCVHEAKLQERIKHMSDEDAARAVANRDRGRKMHAQRKERGKVRVRSNYVTCAQKRMDELTRLPDPDAHALMRERRNKAYKRIMARKAAGGYKEGEYERAIETLECLHPNVFTLAEVRAMQGKKGTPPGPKRGGPVSEEELARRKAARRRDYYDRVGR